MKRLAFAILVLAAFPQAHAAGGGGHAVESVDIDLSNKASLQRGAQVFANYCVSCHSAKFMRYARLAEDLELTPEQVQEHLIFGAGTVQDSMDVAMQAEEAEKWFGVPPPDLSLTARARGSDWLYTYLKGFYIDESATMGVNNAVFPDVAMPHVLVGLQGEQHMVDGHLELAEPGALSPEEYDGLVRDLVAFLTYVGEPAKLERYGLGFKVLMFLLVMTGLMYLVKREYWKDVH